MNDDQRLLASAALDGHLTADERARAESDPQVMAELERLRLVRAVMPVVDAPDPDRREAAIAAALAVFDHPERVDDAPNVVAPLSPSRATRHRNRWLAPLAAAAAAVVAVIAVGGIVATRDDGGDEDSSSVALATVQSAAAPADQELSAAAATESDEAAGEVTDPDTAADATSDAAEATGGSSPAADNGQELAPTAASPLGSPEDLAAFVSAGARSTTDVATACAGGRFVGAASYLVGAEPVAVEVFEVDTPHQAVARRIGDCLVVASAPLP